MKEGRIRLAGKRDAFIQRDHYEVVKEFIITQIQEKGSVSLTDLLDLAHARLFHLFKTEVAWFILQVKLDLYSRGLIRLFHDHERTQMITLKRKARIRHRDD